MPDEDLMRVGEILFTAGLIFFIVFAVLGVGPLSGVSALGFAVLISAASAVAGVLVLIIGGLREGDRGRVVYLRRAPVLTATPVPETPRFCAKCGSELRPDPRGLVCPACGSGP